MKTKDETNWIKKQKGSPISKRTSKKDWTTSMPINEKHTSHPDANVSVFTKTTTPKVVINAENTKNNHNNLSWKKNSKYDVLIFLCFIMMCIIILATFFISLQTYNIIKELSDYIIL